MNITYTGKLDLIGTQQDNVDAKLAKLSKFLENRGGDKQAHIILAHHKNQYRAEITLNFLDHSLAAEHQDPDQFTAISLALDKVEKQILKLRDKRREGPQGPREVRDLKSRADASISLPAADGDDAADRGPRVFRVEEQEDRKPMTIEEAMLEIENDGDYCVFRDAETNRLSVLLRRPDGNFDLIEG